MEGFMLIIASSMLLLVCSTPVNAQKAASPPIPSPTLAPAPAPAPEYVNITHLFTYAGPYGTFLSYLEQTGVLETFQNQANNTEEGITIFAPNNVAFANLKNPSLSNLTKDQLRSVCLFHALAHYYALSDFQNLTQLSPVTTFAGGQYTLNFSDATGVISVYSGWTTTKISSSISATSRAAVYEINKVLLPEAIFGTDIPPTAAPAPAPETPAPAADSPAADVNGKSSPTSTTKSPSSKISSLGNLAHLALAFATGVACFL